MISRALEAWALIAALITNSVLLTAALLARMRPSKRGQSGIGALGQSVLLVRPFRGVDADARTKHESLLDQAYQNCSFQFVCTSRDDPGLPIARSLCSTKAHRAKCVIADGFADVASDKARNMISAWHSTTDPFVGFCDSDLSLPSDAVSQCMSAFDHDKVGAVFAHCVIDSPGALGRIAMLTLTGDAYAFLIGCARLGIAPFLEGGLMILRREAVNRAGGIEMISGAIGDDTRLGRRLRRASYELRLAPFVIVHRSDRQSTRDFVSCYRRWLACHRTEASSGFWAEILLNPTVAPLAFAAFGGGLGWEIVVASVLFRTMVTVFIDRALLGHHGVRLGWWSCLRPVADVLHFCLCLSVVVYPWITWRGIRYAVGLRDTARAGDSLGDRAKRGVAVETGAV